MNQCVIKNTNQDLSNKKLNKQSRNQSNHNKKRYLFTWFSCTKLHNLHPRKKPLEQALLMDQRKFCRALQRWLQRTR